MVIKNKIIILRVANIKAKFFIKIVRYAHKTTKSLPNGTGRIGI